MHFFAATSASGAGEAYSRLLGVIVVLGFAFCALIFFVVSLVKASTRRTRGWMISAAISGIVMMGCLAAGVSMITAAVSTAAQVGTGAARPKELGSKDGTVSLKVPGTWVAMPELRRDAIIAAGDKASQRYVFVIPTPKSVFPGNLQEFDRFATKGMQEVLEDEKVSDPESLKLGGFDAIRRSISGTTAGRPFTYYEQVLIETRDTYYQLLLWTMFSHSSAAELEFRNISGSFAAEAGPSVEE